MPFMASASASAAVRRLVRTGGYRRLPKAFSLLLSDPHHVHADLQRVLAAAENDAANRADIAVVAAPPKRDVAGRRQHVVGGIDVDPAAPGTVHGEPGVRGVGADAARLPWRRNSLEVAADVERGQAERTKTRDLGAREVLTDAAAQPEDIGERRRHVRRFGIEREVSVEAAGQIEHRLEVRAAPGKRLPREICGG